MGGRACSVPAMTAGSVRIERVVGDVGFGLGFLDVVAVVAHVHQADHLPGLVGRRHFHGEATLVSNIRASATTRVQVPPARIRSNFLFPIRV